ncbi:MAG TPA: serine/threonine-protein kinase, partial [Polyangiaceae bacterium]
MTTADPDGELTATVDMGGRSPPLLASDFPPGTWMGRYVLLQPLGKGGMGVVYVAYDSDLDRRVALKVLRDRAAGADADAWRARLMREAKAMARLSHPNVVTIYDVGVSTDGRIFLAMEIALGGSLGDWLKAEKPGWKDVVRVLCEAGEGLAAAHRAGIIHRDFKLENVLMGKDGRPRVTDFGLARGAGSAAEEEVQPLAGSAHLDSPERRDSLERARALSGSSSNSLPKLTMTGAWMGTPGYMAPEQYTNDGELDARADVFAFAATLYRALYGKRPFEGATAEAIADATIAGKVREPPKDREVPAWVHKAVLWGLAADREQRPPSIDALLKALRADPNRARRRLGFGALAGALVAALALSVRGEGERRAQACRAMADRLGGVWDEPRKQAIAGAFHATDLGYADDTWARIAKRLDAYAAGWQSTMQRACESSRIRGEHSAAVLDLETACLDERLDELKSLADVLASADRATVENAVQTTTSLHSVEPCTNIDRLSAAVRLPEGAAARAEIRDLEGQVARANHLREAGKHAQSGEFLDRIRARVDRAGYPPVTLTWTMAKAMADSSRDPAASLSEWESAVALAERSHLDREKAASQIAYGDTLNLVGRHAEALVWLSLTDATLSRAGRDPKLALRREIDVGYTYASEGRYADAARVLEGAVEMAKAGRIDDP